MTTPTTTPDALRDKANQPNTTVYETTYTSTHTPWTSATLRPLLERLATRVTAFAPDVDDFVVRKTCLDDPEVCRFQKAHPKLYWMVTDRAVICKPENRQAISALVELRAKVERGELRDGEEANAAATQAVLAALNQGTPGTPP